MASNALLLSLSEAIISNNVKKINNLYTEDSTWQQCNPSSLYETDYGKGYVILLHLACSYGRFEIVSFFCNSQHCDVNCQDHKKRNALHHLIKSGFNNYASNKDRISTTKVLLKKCCNIHAQDMYGNTPIHMAIYFHDLTVLRVLLEERSLAKVVVNKQGNTPLHVACISGFSKHVRDEIISLLIQFCPNYLFRGNKKGYNPLFLACCANHSFYLEKLAPYYSWNLQQRSSVNYDNLLHVAVHANKLCNVKWLVSQYSSQWFECSINNSGKTPLHLIRSIECLKALFDGGFSVNVQDSEGNSLLHTLLVNSRGLSILEQKELVRYLLQLKQCDVNISNEKHLTPLHIAVKLNLLEVVELFLLSEHCEVMKPNKEGRSALHMAIELNSLPMIQLLLSDKRVDINFADHEMKTPLHLAATFCHKAILDCFCDFTSSFSREGKTPLHLLVCHRDVDTVKHVISSTHPDLTVLTKDGNTVVHLASMHGKVEILSFLLSLGVLGINDRNFSLSSCLHLAVKHSQIEVVEWLLEVGNCDPCLVNIYGLSPLAIALYNRDFDVLRSFISSGVNAGSICTRSNSNCLHLAAESNKITFLKYCLRLLDINSVNSNLETPFFIAVKHSHVEMVKTLAGIDQCNVNARNIDGNSPVHEAVCKNSAEIAQILVDLPSCNLNVRNHEGLTPLHAAFQLGGHCPSIGILLSSSKCDKLVITSNGNNILHLSALFDVKLEKQHLESWSRSLINSRNFDLDTPLHIAVHLSRLELVELLVDVPEIDVSIRNQDDHTPFHLAIIKGDKNIVSHFVKTSEAKTESKSWSNNNKMALHLAAQEGKLEMLEFLLSLRLFNINAKNDLGQTPLHIAIASGFADIAEMLIKVKQCNVVLPDEDGNTPLHLACKMNGNSCASLRITKILLRTGKVTPRCVNKDGKSPVELAKGHYEVLHELLMFLKVTTHNPLENSMKIFVMGNSEVGKSSLIQALCTEAKYNILTKKKLVYNISELTAGIVPRTFHSKHFGHVVLYEFAGQPEFYSPHAAILEKLIDPSPPIFVIVVSLINSDEKILTDVRYWCKFISHQCKTRQDKSGTFSPPHAIIALSHYDIFKKQNRQIKVLKEWLHEQLDLEFPTPNFEFRRKMSALDCRRIASKGLTHLQHLLCDSCCTLRIECDIDFNCHYLIAFLKKNFHSHHAIQMKDILDEVHSDSFIPKDVEKLMQLLSTLHDQSLILLLKNVEDCCESWIILQKNELLSEVTGSVFSPSRFSQHRPNLAFSTGVVPLTNIKKHFAKYDSEMLTSFFSHLEFCSLITDPMAFKLIEKEYSPQSGEKYYFFPGLIRATYPSKEDIWKPPVSKSCLKCGWYYEANKFELLPRFVHVLILRVAFAFALKELGTTDCPQSPVLNRRCSIWKNGIHWLNECFETIIEVGIKKNWVSVIIQCEDTPEIRVHCAQLLLKLINMIREAKDEFCTTLSMTEYFISPECIDYPIFKSGMDVVLYGLDDVSGTGIVTDRHGHHSIQVFQLVPFEPFLYCRKSLISDILLSRLPTCSDVKVKDEMAYDSQMHPEQLKLLDAFFLLFQKNCFSITEQDKSLAVFSRFIVKCSILSERLRLDLSCENHEEKRQNNHPESKSSIILSGIHLNCDNFHEIAQILGATVSHEWMNIGVLIGVPMEKLKEIRSSTGMSSDTCLHKMLSCYFNYGLSNAWNTLISAVKQFSTVAAKQLLVLCQKLNPPLQQYDLHSTLKEVKYRPEDQGVPKINIQNIFWFLIQYASKWCRIGECLKIPPECLESIHQDFSNCRDRLREIIYAVCAQMDAKYTWFSLANAIETIHAEAAAKLRANGIVEYRASVSTLHMYSGQCLLQLSEHHITVWRSEPPREGMLVRFRSEDIERVSFDGPQNSITFHIKSCKNFYTFTFDNAADLDSFDELLREYYF